VRAMFEEGQLYAPVTRTESGDVVVHLGADHPGFNDPDYRERRNAIAAGAMAWESGTPVRRVRYTEAEDEVWRLVSAELAVKHAKYAVREFNEAKAAVALPDERVPQLDEVTARLAPLTGFAYHPAPGLVELRRFYGALGEGVFHSTQYVRHPSQPLYTPEPDIIHEVIATGTCSARGASRRSSAPPGARSRGWRPTPRCRRSPTCSGSRSSSA
jgi:phenylalanine-4-hydroxylase